MKHLAIVVAALLFAAPVLASEGTYITTYPDKIEFYHDNDLDTQAGHQRIMQLQRASAVIDRATTLSSTLAVTGAQTFTGSTNMAVPVGMLHAIRFCGNGSATGIADYMGPVLLDDTEADLVFGGAGCDALNNATEATADAPWHSSFTYKPVGMVCVGRCTGATAANDAITYSLRSAAAAADADMTCTAPAWTGDDNIQQCSVRDATPTAIAAGATVAIKTIGTNDACADAGDDFECIVYVTF